MMSRGEPNSRIEFGISFSMESGTRVLTAEERRAALGSLALDPDADTAQIEIDFEQEAPSE